MRSLGLLCNCRAIWEELGEGGSGFHTTYGLKSSRWERRSAFCIDLWFMAYGSRGAQMSPAGKTHRPIVLIVLCLQFLSRLIICWLPLAPDHKSVWENTPGMKTWNSSCENANPTAPPRVIIKAEGPLSRIKLLVWGR